MGMLTVVAALHGTLGLALAAQSPEPRMQSSSDPDRLYGVVTSAAGERFEGYLRWDRNETHWVDFLDGRREISREHEQEAERLDADLRARRRSERSITLPSVRITWDEDDGVPLETTAAAIRFGHLRSLEVMGPRRAMLVLTSGDSLELVSGSSDLGGGFRGLVVERLPQDDVELDWDELSRVDFRTAPVRATPPNSRRLYGTLETRDGLELTGFVAWDLDEALGSDVLDGEENREDRNVPFQSIESISRESGSSARVRQRNGTEMVLTGTNDVDSDNRGIEITSADFGRVVVSWDDFVSLRFHAAPTGDMRSGREAFHARGRLRGTAASSDGRRATGLIRWDNADEGEWDTLVLTADGLAMTIELGRVLSIAKGIDGARVTLVDGQVLEADADEAGDLRDLNRGVFVQTDAGTTEMVRWKDLLTVTFER